MNPKIKKIIALSLGLFIAFSIIYWIINESKERVAEPAIAAASVSQKTSSQITPEPEKQIRGLYFHGTNRCYVCNVMEGHIRNVITTSFQEEAKSGLLTFESINVEEYANRHYIQTYQLRSISFFLTLRKNGREIKYENIDMIWKLAGDESMFKNYIKNEIKRFLEM